MGRCAVFELRHVKCMIMVDNSVNTKLPSWVRSYNMCNKADVAMCVKDEAAKRDFAERCQTSWPCEA
eukprot:12405395-Karenia_brevis.AAC.1